MIFKCFTRYNLWLATIGCVRNSKPSSVNTTNHKVTHITTYVHFIGSVSDRRNGIGEGRDNFHYVFRYLGMYNTIGTICGLTDWLNSTEYRVLRRCAVVAPATSRRVAVSCRQLLSNLRRGRTFLSSRINYIVPFSFVSPYVGGFAYEIAVTNQLLFCACARINRKCCRQESTVICT